jgi:hypothetical protein
VWGRGSASGGFKMRKRLFISAAASKAGIVVLACILLSVAPRPAYAIIDGWTALKIAEGVKKAYDFVIAVDSGLSDSNRTILAVKELRHIAQILVRHLSNLRFDMTPY